MLPPALNLPFKAKVTFCVYAVIARLLTNNWAIAYNSGMVTEFNEVQAHLREEQVFATVPGDVIVVEFSATNEQLLSRSEIVELLDAVIVFPVPDEPRISIYRRLLNLL